MDFADARTDLSGTITVGKINGTVSADKKVNVLMGGIEIGCRINRDLTVALGDRVLVLHDGINRWVLCRVFPAAVVENEDAPSDDVPPPKPATTTGVTVLAPIETRSYRVGASFGDGWRTDNSDVYQGEFGAFGNHTGCIFYGTKGPAGLKGSTVTSATIRVKRLSGGTFGAQGTTMRLLTNKTRPGGAPTLTGSTAGPSLAVGKTDGSFTIPTSWAQDIVNGTAGGLAFSDADGSPYVRFAGKGELAAAFTLTIRWTRS
jgi:hypothetical protein